LDIRLFKIIYKNMKIKKYNQFLIQESLRLILEANLKIESNLVSILNKMESPIAKFILDLVDQDLNLDINLLDRDLKEPGYITYYPQKKIDKLGDLYEVVNTGQVYTHWSEAEKFFGIPLGSSKSDIKKGALGKIVKIEDWSVVNGRTENLYGSGDKVCHFVSDGVDYIINLAGLKKVEIDPKLQQSGKSGRIITKILGLVQQNFTTKEIEKFSNEYKSLTSQSDFELVNGDNIRYWYDGERYMPGGTLGSSCMRYDKCQRYFGIYTQNPEVCQLLILKNTEDPEYIDGRALVWKLNDGRIFMDRVYGVSDHIMDMFINYAKGQGWLYKVEQSYSGYVDIIDSLDGSIYRDDLEVTLKYEKDHYSKFPYMDTLKYWDSNNLYVICNDSSRYDYAMSDTDGGDGGCDQCGGEGRVDCNECDGEGRYNCSECEGEGQNECSDCDGRGRINCDECQEGQNECSFCEGEGQVECDSCEGEGKVDGEDCEDCSGSGKKECEKCSGEGQIKCGDCNGRSTLECPECEGNRKVDCSECEGDGTIYCNNCDGNGRYSCPECG